MLRASSAESAWRATIAACIVGSKTATRRLPPAFAVYIATSALRSNSSVCWCGSRPTAMPIEPPTTRSWPATANDTWSASMIRPATAFARPSPSSSVSSSANSSPPSRAARSSLRMQLLIRSATAASRRSPAAWPSVSLTTLKSSRSRNSTARTLSVRQAPPAAASHLLGEHGPVREPGQRVVVGLVPELLLEPRQLRERLLQLAVLERDRGLVGERLEQAQVVIVERGPLGQPVRDGHRADHPGLAHQRRRPSPGGSSGRRRRTGPGRTPVARPRGGR